MPQGRGAGKRKKNRRRGRAVGSRRVLLRHAEGLDERGGRAGPVPVPSGASFRLSHVKAYPVVRLTDEGVDWGVWPQKGDEIGFGMDPYESDDCLRAAIATCTQTPVEQVPDFALERRLQKGESPAEVSRTSWERLHQWAATRRLTLEVSGSVPMEHERWIGVVESANTERFIGLTQDEWREYREETAVRRGAHEFTATPFQDHCLVMRGEDLHFDPACSVRVPPGALYRYEFDPADITYGIAFTRERK